MAALTTNQIDASCFPSSSSTPHWNHHVFMSFRGKDTRNNFTGHLHKALKQAGLRTFIDEDELHRGKQISPQLRKAIRESRICIIVFSNNYASSRWCLDELIEILECKKLMGRLVFPVFYDVDPSDVRHQKGSFADAFAIYTQRFVAEMEKQKMEIWRAALTEVANLSGYCLKTDANGHEATLIEKIVMDVLLEVDPVNLNVSENLVGVDYRVEEIISLISLELNDVRLIGIYGLGGIGKTTVAKAVFNKILHRFEGSCFVANVKDVSRKPDGLVMLQQQLLAEILKRNVAVVNSDKGIALMSERCWSRRVLIVLDDLDELSQIKSLLGQRHRLGSGSRIIITTRDVHLLNQAGVDKRYEVKELNNNESLELFSWHAFRKPIPSKDYVLLSKDVASYCRGLPLALEVIGSYLVDKNMVEWKSSLEKLHHVPHREIQEKLKISFDALGDDKVQAIFLDLACFFINWKKDYLINIWNACGFFAEDGISNLMRKCLLKTDFVDMLTMHDLLRDMGGEIIRKESPNRPANRSRLWRCEDVFNVLMKNKGTEVIEAIILDLSGSKQMQLNTRAFERMSILRLLQIDNVHLTGSFENLFEELKWLHWHYCPLQCLPFDFHPEKLVILDMQHSKLNILWHNIKVLENLTILDLSHSKCLTNTPDFSGVKGLERLILKDCTSLLEVHPSVGLLGRLCYLDLSECKNLKKFPSSICDLASLEEFYLDHCSNLEKLPKQIGNLKCLRRLNAGYTGIIQLLDSIKLLGRLVYLNLRYCENLRTLPSSVCDLGSLEELDLPRCSNLEKLPEQLGNMKCLRRLSVGFTAINQLPNSIKLLSRLVYLNLQYCENLRALPSSICKLGSLEELYLYHCSNLESLPEQIGHIKCLRRLDVGFTAIVQLPDSIELLIRLVYLNLEHCENLRSLPNNICNLRLLEELSLYDCSNLVKLPDSIGLLDRLVELELKNCRNLRNLPASIGNLRSLEELNISGCSNLERLPEQLGNMESLRIVHAKGTTLGKVAQFHQTSKNLTELSLEGLNTNLDNRVLYSPLFSFSKLKFSTPSSIFGLCSLRWLQLHNCGLRDEDIPDDIGIRLSSLQDLDLSGNNFYSLPSSFSQLLNLRRLSLTNCTSLVSLPLLPPNLCDLDASGCTSLEKIPNLSNLKQLEFLGLTDCSRLVEVQGLENLNSLGDVFMGGCSNLAVSLFQRYFEHAYKSFLPREIPVWFIDQSTDSSISFELPLNLANNFHGISLWVVYAASDNYSKSADYYSAVVKSKTSGITWIHGTDHFKQTSQGHSWVSCIKSNFRSGDSIEISIKEVNGAKVERCGIHLLYKPDITTQIEREDRKRCHDVDVHLYNPESSKRLRT